MTPLRSLTALALLIATLPMINPVNAGCFFQASPIPFGPAHSINHVGIWQLKYQMAYRQEKIRIPVGETINSLSQLQLSKLKKLYPKTVIKTKNGQKVAYIPELKEEYKIYSADISLRQEGEFIAAPPYVIKGKTDVKFAEKNVGAHTPFADFVVLKDGEKLVGSISEIFPNSSKTSLGALILPKGIHISHSQGTLTHLESGLELRGPAVISSFALLEYDQRSIARALRVEEEKNIRKSVYWMYSGNTIENIYQQGFILDVLGKKVPVFRDQTWPDKKTFEQLVPNPSLRRGPKKKWQEASATRNPSKRSSHFKLGTDTKVALKCGNRKKYVPMKHSEINNRDWTENDLGAKPLRKKPKNHQKGNYR